MNRRETALALLALGVAPLTSVAQQASKVWRIGYLYLSTPKLAELRLAAFKEAFRKLGYIEGRDYVLESRFVENHGERLPMLAEELVRLGPDLIIATPASPTLAV